MCKKKAAYLASVATTLGSGCDWLAILQVLKDLLGGLGSQVLLYIEIINSFSSIDDSHEANTYKVIIVYSKDRSVDACTCTFDLNQCKFAILGGLTNFNLQVVFDGLKNLGGSTSTELARSGSTQLQEVLANRLSVERHATS